MLNIFKDMGPNIEKIVDMGFSSPKGLDCSLEDEKTYISILKLLMCFSNI